MRILILCRYNSRGASSRLRSHQYVDGLCEQGNEIQVDSLFGDQYLDYLYTGSSFPTLKLIQSYLRRIFLLLFKGRRDIVWIEKESLPWLPAWLEKLLLLKSQKLVLDYDDAIFHRYDQHKNWLVKFLLANKIPKLMKFADLVIAGNPYIAEYAKQAGAARVAMLPTAVNLAHYPTTTAPSERDETFVLGWIGTPYTARYLKRLAKVFEELKRTGPIKFRFIGAPPGMDIGVSYEAPSWSELNEASEIIKLDCGIMPLDDNRFERGKCGYKIIQYFACGIPAVASPVGVNTRIIDPGINGFLASNEQEWLQSINKLRNDAALAGEMGRQGRLLVEQYYSYELNLKKIDELLRAVTTGQPG